MISIAINLSANHAVGADGPMAVSIEAESVPVVANPLPGQTALSLFTPGVYSIAEGEITAQLAEASINGGAFSDTAMTQVLAALDTVTVREMVTASGGQLGFFLAPSVTVAAAAPVASVRIVQTNVDFGDVLGADVTASASIVQPGEPALEVGDISLSWQVNGAPASAGYVLGLGDVVEAVAVWDHPTGSGSSISTALAVPLGEAPELTIALASSDYSAGDIVRETDLVWSIQDPGYPALQNEDVLVALEVDGAPVDLPYTVQGGDLLVPLASASHSTGPISVSGPSVSVSTRFNVLGETTQSIEIDGATGNLSVTLVSPAALAGVYALDVSGVPLNSAELQNAPQCFVAPFSAGAASPDVGETITGQNGLWLYDSDFAAPVQSNVWQRSDTGASGWSDIPGATGDAYVVQSADQGKFLRRLDTLAQPGTGSRKAASNVIAIGVEAAPTVSLNPSSATLVPGTTGTVASLTYGGGPADTVTLTGPDAASFALSNGNASLNLVDVAVVGTYTATVEAANAGGTGSATFALTVEAETPTFTVSLGALTAGQTFGEPGSGADVEAVLGGAPGNPDDPLFWECSVNNGSSYEPLVAPVSASEGEQVVIRISDVDHPSGAFSAISNTVTVGSDVIYAGALLTADQENFLDTSAFSVTPTPDPAITVSNGLLTVNGTQSGNKNLWQTGSDQVAAEQGDLYSIIADFGPIAGGSVILNTNLSGVNGSLTALTGGDFKRQSVFEVTTPVSEVSGGVRALSGRSFTSDTLATFRLTDLLNLPQAIFLVVGQSNWIGNSAGYDKDDIEHADGCLYTPATVNRAVGADDFPSAAGEMLPMIAMEPMQHQTLNFGQGPGADFCRTIRVAIPATEAVHYFAGARAAAGFKDGDLWAGSLDGAGQPTGGSAYVSWWSEARKLYARAQAWNPDSYIAGVIVCVGESDIGGTWDEGRNASESVANLSQMIDDIRSEWGANIPVVISEIGYQLTDTGVPEFIEAQRQLASGSGNAIFEKSRCAYVERPSVWALTDGTHYDADTNRQRGQDAAIAMASVMAEPLAATSTLSINYTPTEAGDTDVSYTPEPSITDIVFSITSSPVAAEYGSVSVDTSALPVEQVAAQFSGTTNPGDVIKLTYPMLHEPDEVLSMRHAWRVGDQRTSNTSLHFTRPDGAESIFADIELVDASAAVVWSKSYEAPATVIVPVAPELENIAATVLAGTGVTFSAFVNEGEAEEDGFLLTNAFVTSGNGVISEFRGDGTVLWQAPATSDTTVIELTIQNDTTGSASKTYTASVTLGTAVVVGQTQFESLVFDQHLYIEDFPGAGPGGTTAFALQNSPLNMSSGFAFGEFTGPDGDYNLQMVLRGDVDGENSSIGVYVNDVLQFTRSYNAGANGLPSGANGFALVTPGALTLVTGDIISFEIDGRLDNAGDNCFAVSDSFTLTPTSAGGGASEFGSFVQSQSTNNAGGNGVELPADPTENNYLFVFGASSNSSVGTPTFSAGWTEVGQIIDTSDSDDLGLAVAYKKSDGSETGSVEPIMLSGVESWNILELEGAGNDLNLVGLPVTASDNPSSGQSSVTLNFNTGDADPAVIVAHFAYLYETAGSDFNDSAALAAGWVRREGSLSGTSNSPATWSYTKELPNGGADSITLTITAGANTHRTLAGIGYITRGAE